MSQLPFLVTAWLVLVGLVGILTSRDLIHLVICLSVLQSATYVLLLGVGYRRGGTAPVLDGVDPGDEPLVDPVVQALTVTDVVVNAAITAVLLAICVQIRKRQGSLDPDGLRSMRG